MNKSPLCCGFESNWVENVVGKGYFFCAECRKEVSNTTNRVELEPMPAGYIKPGWVMLSDNLKHINTIPVVYKSEFKYWLSTETNVKLPEDQF